MHAENGPPPRTYAEAGIQPTRAPLLRRDLFKRATNDTETPPTADTHTPECTIQGNKSEKGNGKAPPPRPRARRGRHHHNHHHTNLHAPEHITKGTDTRDTYALAPDEVQARANVPLIRKEQGNSMEIRWLTK